MKIRQDGSIRPQYLTHCARRRATSGQSRSLATMVSFGDQILSMDEVPDRAVIDLQAPLGQFVHKPGQGEVLRLLPLQQPSAVRARNRLRLMPAYLSRSDASGIMQPGQPIDRCADAHVKLRRGTVVE